VDRLTLEVEAIELGRRQTPRGVVDHGAQARLRIVVNGRDLLTVVKELEAPCAEADGATELAGSYHYLSGYTFPSGLFEGRPADPDLRAEGQVALMGCDCGEVGCWPFLVSITKRSGEVRWSGFRQPFRPRWDYDRLGMLRFDAAAYDAEIARAEARFAEVARLPDELVAALAADVREQIEIVLEIADGVLTAWQRREELMRLSADDLALIRSDAHVRDAAIEEVIRRLGVTPRHAGAIAMQDTHAMSPAEIASYERLRTDLIALRTAPDDVIREGYNEAVTRRRSDSAPS
jgi:hypothetical protein